MNFETIKYLLSLAFTLTIVVIASEYDQLNKFSALLFMGGWMMGHSAQTNKKGD